MSTDSLLDHLRERKTAARTARLLRQAARHRFRDAQSLIRFHEILLFLRAYPASREIVDLSEEILSGFAARVKLLGEDLTEFEESEVSGIAGTHLTAVFSYHVARHLAWRHGDAVIVDWERHDEADRLIATLPHLIPLLDDDAMVEAVVPWKEWLRASSGGELRDLPWLLAQVGCMEPTARLQADRYSSLRIPLRWNFGDSGATRTHMRQPSDRIFFHDGPFIKPGEVSFAEIPALDPLPVRELNPAEGRQTLDLALDTSVARFRELHGFTYGDPRHVYEVDAGRGVLFYFSGALSEWRLPLRAYHAATIWKNGVPIGYFEALSLFERLEAGFNLYYTFRGGETAWLYRQLLKMFHQLLGVTCIAIDPYQIGFDNEEAIQSGAFWFYRKLGFRSTDPAMRDLTEREEKRIAARPGYRSSPATLRRLARHPMVYEFPGTETGDWDRFHPRNLGLAAARAMADHFESDLVKMRGLAVRAVARMAGLAIETWTEDERRVLAEWAPLLALVRGLERWPEEEKHLLGQILRAKAGAEEADCLRLMQWHPRLRAEMVRLGSL